MHSVYVRNILFCLYLSQAHGNIPMFLNTKLVPVHVIELMFYTALPNCADKCVYTTDCLSVSFSRHENRCELYGVTSADVPSGDKINEENTVLLDVIHWPKSRTGACWNKPCGEGKRCIPDRGSYICTQVDQVGCKPYKVPEHGIVIDHKGHLNATKGDVYPPGTKIGLNCRLPYYTEIVDPRINYVTECQKNFQWGYQYECKTVEERCIYQMLEKTFPGSPTIFVEPIIPDWKISDALLSSVTGWMPSTNDDQHFIQVWFWEASFIGGVVTKGGSNGNWVTSYKISYGLHCDVPYMLNDYTYLQSENGTTKIFQGNTDSTNPVTNHFDRILELTCLRIYPITFEGGIAMRLEVLGCQTKYANY